MISYAITLFVFFLFSSFPSLAFPGLKPREVCYENDVLLSFQLWIHDSTPFCSSLLSISDSTSFVGPTRTVTTTITTVTATSYDTVETFTVPQVTAFTTTTTTLGEILHKRQDNISSVPFVFAPVPIIATATANNPIVSKFPSIAQNASLAGEAYSACSCLRLTSSTVTTQPTIQLTRTINGIDYEALGTTTLTSGTITVTSTLAGLPLPVTSPGVPNSTFSAARTGFLPPVTFVPTNTTIVLPSNRPFPTLNISTIPTFSVSAGIFPSLNGTANSLVSVSGRPTPIFNFTINPTLPRSGFLPSSSLARSGLVPLPTANFTANATALRSGFLPLPTVNLTTSFNASVSGRLPRPILNTTASGRLSLPSANATSRPLSPITGHIPLPTINGTNRTLPLSGSLPVPTNITLPISAHLPLPILNGTNRTVPPSGIQPPPTGALSPLSSNASRPSLPHLPSPIIPHRPIGTQIAPAGCPAINNTIYQPLNTTDTTSAFRIQCSLSYPGLAFADLDAPDLFGCIRRCDDVNAAFATRACDGVSFAQYADGVRCRLLSGADVRGGGRADAEVVSAVVIDG